MLLYRQQRPGVTLGELAFLNQRLHLIRQLQQAKEVGDGRPVPSHQTGDLCLGKLELLAQTLVSGGLIDGRQVVALQVFDEGEREQRLVVHFPHDRRDLGPAQALNRAPAALAGDQLGTFRFAAAR